MCFAHEFIRLGISRQLEGAQGLYYLIRKELRMDQMQRSLDDISRKLDEIIDNQREIYGEIVKMNNKCENMIQATLKMSKNLNNIEQNTAISAYNSERILKEEEYQTFFQTYNFYRSV
ncbi:MAG: hypothetical protein IJT23_10220 [Clostridia bacterium]|nr:hypothetical protein [Clostridia bacterium]